ncbi:hypothetical protein vseg_002740 [Gypsophila vaccaria]
MKLFQVLRRLTYLSWCRPSFYHLLRLILSKKVAIVDKYQVQFIILLRLYFKCSIYLAYLADLNLKSINTRSPTLLLCTLFIWSHCFKLVEFDLI